MSLHTVVRVLLFLGLTALAQADDRLRLIVETDAGGDPDDEQSLVRLLVYASEFDIEGIIANRAVAREKENLNPVRDGLGIVQALINAYGECHNNLVVHDPRFPSRDQLLVCTVAGYDNCDDGVHLIIRAVDSPDPRPVWFSNWGTDNGSAVSSLKRALDLVLRERGPEGYAKFKSRLRLCSADKFGDHIGKIDPPFPIWIFATRPALDGKRWYHRFSPLTATAGDFNLERDVRRHHGPLGALYPTNTTLPQKEGDTMYFLYLLPTGMNEPMQPSWGSWGGRYGAHEEFPGKPYYWANVQDTWQGRTHRDQTLVRWATALQNDFAARMDWCVADDFRKANHRPVAVLNGDSSQRILHITVRSGETVKLSADSSRDPDGHNISAHWFTYPEAGSFRDPVPLTAEHGPDTSVVAPRAVEETTLHVILEIRDDGSPALSAFRRAVITVTP